MYGPWIILLISIFKKIKILAKESVTFEMKILESIYIKKYKDLCINLQSDSDVSLFLSVKTEKSSKFLPIYDLAHHRGKKFQKKHIVVFLKLFRKHSWKKKLIYIYCNYEHFVEKWP